MSARFNTNRSSRSIAATLFIALLATAGTALAYTAAAAGPTPTGVSATHTVAGSGSLIFTGGVVNAYTGANMQGMNVTVGGLTPVGRSRSDGYFEGRSSSLPSLISLGLTGYTTTVVPMPKNGVDFGDVPVFANQFLTEIYSALALGTGNKYQGGALVVDSTGAPISGALVEASTVTAGMYGMNYLDNNWGVLAMLTINRSGFSSPPSSGTTGNTGLAMNIGVYSSVNKSYVLRVRRTAGGAYCTSLTRPPVYPSGYPVEASAIIGRTPGAVNLAVFVCN